MKPEFEIVVVGGGLVGSLLTHSLSRAGFKVALIEKGDLQKRTFRTGRAFALSLASCNYLKALGFVDILEQYGNPIKGVIVTEGEAGRGSREGILEFMPSEIGEESFGCMIQEENLLEAVGERLKKNKAVRIFSKTAVEDAVLDDGSLIVNLSNGKSIPTELLAICDGSQSNLGSRLGYSHIKKNYRQGAITCTVRHEKSNEGLAYQFFMPTGPIAFLPLSDHSVCIVWTNTQKEVNRLDQLDDDQFLEELRPAFGTFLGDISLEGPRGSWSLELSMASKMVSARFALLGDAVRKIHPLAGQGLNLGLRDAAVFLEIVETAKYRGEDIGFPTVLERYQRWRMFDSVSFAVATDFFNWAFTNPIPGNQLVRQLGTGIISNIMPLKGYLIREAAGLSGDIPELMKNR